MGGVLSRVHANGRLDVVKAVLLDDAADLRVLHLGGVHMPRVEKVDLCGRRVEDWFPQLLEGEGARTPEQVGAEEREVVVGLCWVSGCD